jgi:hypothetical protein
MYSVLDTPTSATLPPPSPLYKRINKSIETRESTLIETLQGTSSKKKIEQLVQRHYPHLEIDREVEDVRLFLFLLIMQFFDIFIVTAYHGR